MEQTLQRFFVPLGWIDGDRALLKEHVARQISRVLRMSPGDRVVLLDNSGSKYITELESFSNDLIEGRIVSVSAGDGEPRTQITLYQSLAQGRQDGLGSAERH